MCVRENGRGGGRKRELGREGRTEGLEGREGGREGGSWVLYLFIPSRLAMSLARHRFTTTPCVM
jgi:hypothetical protein